MTGAKQTDADPLFDGIPDERLEAATEGCNELSCIYHGRINIERRRRQRAHGGDHD